MHFSFIAERQMNINLAPKVTLLIISVEKARNLGELEFAYLGMDKVSGARSKLKIQLEAYLEALTEESSPKNNLLAYSNPCI